MLIAVDVLIFILIFTNTPTSVIYTYLHSLSLRYALTVSPARFAHGAPHAIGGACPPSVHRSPTSCSPGTTSRRGRCRGARRPARRSEEHTSELQSLMRISYAVFCLIKKNNNI